jgi:DNA-binding protein HU-beta
MTKAEIVNEISYQTGIEKPTVQKTVEALMETIKGSLVNGENIYLRGFGSFVIKKRANKTARNIAKNITIVIPAHYVPSFKPAEIFISKISL